MLELGLPGKSRRTLRILCIGAHSDDVEIGCGGTLLEWQDGGRRIRVDWAVLSAPGTRQAEAAAGFHAFVPPRHRGELTIGDFPDGRFPHHYAAIKEFVEALKPRAMPDVVFCHAREDRHQDHRVVNEMVWNTFRDHLILEYEIPKWDGDLGQPNLYVPVSLETVRRKVAGLTRAHRSQAGKDWFTPDTFTALLRLRGMECRSPSGHAEAFTGRKLRLQGP